MNEQYVVNDLFRVLRVLHHNCNDDSYCILTQETIGERLGLSRSIISTIMKKLNDDKFIIIDKNRYKPTNYGMYVMKEIEKWEEERGIVVEV